MRIPASEAYIAAKPKARKRDTLKKCGKPLTDSKLDADL